MGETVAPEAQGEVGLRHDVEALCVVRMEETNEEADEAECET